MTLAFENCKECNRVFKPMMNEKLCERCRSKHNNAYSLVKEHLVINPYADLNELVQETGVDEDEIKMMLKEEKIRLLANDSFHLECAKCKRPIPSGKLCEFCNYELRSAFNGASRELLQQTRQEQSKPTTAFHSRRR